MGFPEPTSPTYALVSVAHSTEDSKVKLDVIGVVTHIDPVREVVLHDGSSVTTRRVILQAYSDLGVYMTLWRTDATALEEGALGTVIAATSVSVKLYMDELTLATSTESTVVFNPPGTQTETLSKWFVDTMLPPAVE